MENSSRLNDRKYKLIMKKLISLTIVVFILISTLSMSAFAFDSVSYDETHEHTDHDHAMDINFEIAQEEMYNSTAAACSHTFGYTYYNSTQHIKVCRKNCGYGIYENHSRSTCYATTCNFCSGSLPAVHIYTSYWVYVGDYGSNDLHAKVCMGLYGYCGHYTNSFPCNATGEVWTSTTVISGVHPIYRECNGCGIGVQIGSAIHYSSGGCLPGCRG